MLKRKRQSRDPMSMPAVPRRSWTNPKQQSRRATGWFRVVSEVLTYLQIVMGLGVFMAALGGYWWIAFGLLVAMVPMGLLILRRQRIAPLPTIKDSNTGLID